MIGPPVLVPAAVGAGSHAESPRAARTFDLS